ncbi:MAG: FecR family protein [Mediterranea sp.]|jgi:ferric-dicitrate binding protein FerR (iron transport regulator)|nr:FecR family protein [Mediterranea sp.]
MNLISYNRAKGILREFFSQEIKDEELIKRFREWFADERHAAAEKQAALSDLYEEMVGFEKEPDKEVYLAFEKLKSALRLPDADEDFGEQHKHEFIIRRPATFRRMAMRVAAVLIPVVVLASAGWFLFQRDTALKTMEAVGKKQETPVYADIHVEAPQDLEMALPDGSFVYMRKKSQIVYSNNFERDRSLTLKGEAHFKVNKKKGASPFTVTTNNISVVATGTEFKVHAYDRERYTVVWLYEGGVDIHRDAKTYTLKPGQQLIYDKTKSQVNVKEIIVGSAKEVSDIISFEQKPLSDAFQWIESYYGVKIEVDDGDATANLTEEIVSVNFENNISLDDALLYLSIISKGFGYNIVKDANGMLIVKVFAVKTL